MYKIKKIFTSRDGKLEVDPREYGMTQEGLEELGVSRDHLGGATHIFARTEGGPSNSIEFFTRNNLLSFVRSEKPETGWAEYELAKSAAYKPSLGEQGWWNVRVADAPSEVVEGIGLPNSWHVSTFVIFEWAEEGQQPENPDEGPEVPEQPQPPQKNLRMEFSISAPSYAATVRLYTDGTYIISEA